MSRCVQGEKAFTLNTEVVQMVKMLWPLTKPDIHNSLLNNTLIYCARSGVTRFEPRKVDFGITKLHIASYIMVHKSPFRSRTQEDPFLPM
jgi:hypothetical protein